MTHRQRTPRPRRAAHSAAGFSVLELLVSIGVFLALSAMLMASYRTYDSKFAFEAEVYKVAQRIREAQVSAMSVRETKSGSYTISYGVNVRTNNPNNTRILFFSDTNNNGRFDANPTDETEEIIIFRPGVRIDNICGEPPSTGAAVPECPLPLMRISGDLDIMFVRPNPDATLTSGPNTYSHVRLVMKHTRGYVRTIDVWETGQISVQ